MLPRFAKQTIVLLEPVLIVERGETVEDWAAPLRTPVPGCSVQPGDGDADHVHADGETADYTVYVPPGAALPEKFRVELPTAAGQFTVQGEPAPWIFGLRSDHIQIRLIRRAG